ncbi:MFS transporter, SP family, solute carrier family 2 (myo-inositol transporter), member 13 [Cryptococcus bacillisporus CA1873]|uniref:MFS transporter, SP family, solute carrier family 2 (Myo-inositol transporter), member 13 n=1 Tax=Cryptococcus bacillisporus CA1873 TaxID=1296111 RepID=A0ABR5BH44_CRYGA|nr:MFS transporter, SP family, solute carrier family 2 (myo-inositol transporter), member 13 [Cryptococcus bacillisporus CA1873]|eukprot:KIR68153.1 MFS transporter, SP family, solute carrier family 2 (myo-inositol transporter), member 13 [Cryptococcus gattii CA1873]
MNSDEIAPVATSSNSSLPPSEMKAEVTSSGPTPEGLLIDEAVIQAENEDKMTPYLVFLIGSAALGGFLYGYDTGVVGIALPYVGTDLGHALSSTQQEIATAATTIGAIVGAAILGYFADRWGRKWCLLISDLFFTAGAIIIASSFSLGQLIAGRLILGVGVGGAAIICPLYITELAPTAVRGRCVGTNGFFIPFGQTVSVAIGAGLKDVKYNWRILFGLGVVPSLVQLCLMHKLPESPRVLILRGQDDRAREVLKQIYRYASLEVIELKLEIVRAHVQATTVLERSTTWAQRTKKLWCHKPYRRSILTVCMIQVFGQFTGYNTLLYYAGTLFGLVGLSNASLGGLIPSITNTFFLLVGMVFVDRIGRRGLLMKFGPLMIVGLIWCLVAFYFMCKETGGFLVEGFVYNQRDVGLVIAGIVVFVMGFGSTYAHLCWYQSEYLALEIRAIGSAISTTASFSANLVVAVSFLSELETLTPSGTYGLYLGFVVIGYVLAYFCYPETKGLSIDEAFSLFDDDFGVKKSVKMRREKAEAQRRYNVEGGESGQAVEYLGAKPEISYIERVEPVA